MKEYRCTRNASYSHNCLGHHDTTARQGYYIQANTDEEAWEKMAMRFPTEVDTGFTVEVWQSFDVKVVGIKRDDQGNIIS